MFVSRNPLRPDSGASGSREGFSLETVVQVRIAAPQALHQARPEVKREEEQSPPLILPDMHTLMGAQFAKLVVCRPEDHVAKGNGLEPKRLREPGNPYGQPSATDLDHAIDDTRRGSQGESAERAGKAHGGRGCRPSVADKTDDAVHKRNAKFRVVESEATRSHLQCYSRALFWYENVVRNT